MNENRPELRTREEAAARARLCRESVDAAIRRGELAVVKAGRRTLITSDSLEAWLKPREATRAK